MLVESKTKFKFTKKKWGTPMDAQWAEVAQPGFLNLNTTSIWGQIILSCGTYLVHCRITASSAGFYPLEASSTLPKYMQATCEVGAQNKL